MHSILIIKELFLSIVVALILPVFLLIVSVITTGLMYIVLLDELYNDFKFKTSKKVKDEQ